MDRVARRDERTPGEMVLKVAGAGRRRALTQAGALVAAVALVGTFALPAVAATSVDPQAESESYEAVADSAQTIDTVAASAQVDARDGYIGEAAEPTSEQLAAQYRALFAAGQSFPIGDDYYAKDSTNYEGLSSIRYGTRTCTDFVAWRLNRDAGSFGEPWLMDWSYLTPGGGDAYEWPSAWEAHGWPISTTPVVGAVAYFGGNHVGYVAEVYDNGTVLIEDYNWIAYSYDARVYNWGDMVSYLYPPTTP